MRQRAAGPAPRRSPRRRQLGAHRLRLRPRGGEGLPLAPRPAQTPRLHTDSKLGGRKAGSGDKMAHPPRDTWRSLSSQRWFSQMQVIKMREAFIMGWLSSVGLLSARCVPVRVSVHVSARLRACLSGGLFQRGVSAWCISVVYQRGVPAWCFLCLGPRACPRVCPRVCPRGRPRLV